MESVTQSSYVAYKVFSLGLSSVFVYRQVPANLFSLLVVI